MKRILSFLLAVLMVCNLAAPAVAVEVPAEANTFYLDVDKTSVQVGDTVTLSVYSNTEMTNMMSNSVLVDYDETVFELDLNNSSVTGNSKRWGIIDNSHETYGKYTGTSMYHSDSEVTIPNGLLGTIKLKALQVSDNVSFDIITVDASWFNWDDNTKNNIDVKAGPSVVMTVTSAAPTTHTVTLPQNPVGYTIVKADGSALGESDTTVAAGSDFSFQVALAQGYAGTPVVKAGTETLSAVDGVYSVTVNADVTITVEGITKEQPEPTTYTVTLPQNPEGYTIGYNGSTTVEEGKTFTFTVTPANGYEKKENFAVKAGTETLTANTDGSYTITVTGNVTVSVEGIGKKTYTVTLPTGEGFTAATEQPATVAHGDSFTFTVTANTGYGGAIKVMQGTEELAPNEDGSYTITVTGNVNNLTVSGVSANSYSVTFETDGSYVATPDSGTVGHNGSFTFSVAPADGYEGTPVVKANGNVVAAENGSYTITVTDNVTITVTGYTRNSYKVTAGYMTNGTVTFTGVTDGMAAAGATVTVNAQPDENYELFYITVMRGTTEVEVSDDNTFVMPAGDVTVTAVFRAKSNPVQKIEVSHPSIQNNILNLFEGVQEQLRLVVEVAQAAAKDSQTILWKSSNEYVATVDQSGMITAVGNGEATITAEAMNPEVTFGLSNGETAPVASVQVVVSDMNSGYFVDMGEDVSPTLNDPVYGSFLVPVVIGNTDSAVEKYNAYDITLKYDPEYLNLLSSGDPLEENYVEGLSLGENGVIHVHRYGDDKSVNEAAFALAFVLIKGGETDVQVLEAKVGTSEEALEYNASTAERKDPVTLVNSKYRIENTDDLTGFEGAAEAVHGQDYIFKLDPNYEYDFTGTTMGGEPATVINNGDGTFTIRNVTGAVCFAVAKEGKKYNVNVGEDIEGAKEAQYGVPYKATLNKVDGYTYNIEVTVDGTKISHDYNDATGEITIAGDKITGEIIINSNKTLVPAGSFSVMFEGNASDDVKDAATSVAANGTYTFKLDKKSGYKYTLSYTMGGGASQTLDAANSSFSIADVTGNLVITVNRALYSDLTVSVTEYITGNEANFYLITATHTLPQGYGLKYNGKAMFYSNQYNKWCYLVYGAQKPEEAAVKTDITTAKDAFTTLAQTFNVNGSDQVDINDAQLVYDMYNVKYDNIDAVGMAKFLNADTTGNGVVDVNDAAAIVNEIIRVKNQNTTQE